MSISLCQECGIAYDTDNEVLGNEICDNCYTEIVEQPEDKRFRASIYLDICAKNEDEAKQIAEDIALYLGNPMDGDAELSYKEYYNPFVGGVGEIKEGDLIGNNERLKNI